MTGFEFTVVEMTVSEYAELLLHGKDPVQEPAFERAVPISREFYTTPQLGVLGGFWGESTQAIQADSITFSFFEGGLGGPITLPKTSLIRVVRRYLPQELEKLGKSRACLWFGNTEVDVFHPEDYEPPKGVKNYGLPGFQEVLLPYFTVVESQLEFARAFDYGALELELKNGQIFIAGVELPQLEVNGTIYYYIRHGWGWIAR